MNLKRLHFTIPIPRLPAFLRKKSLLPFYAIAFALLLDGFELSLIAFALLLTAEAILPGIFLSPFGYAILLGLLTFFFGVLSWASTRSRIAFPLSIHHQSPILWISLSWLAFTLTISLLPPISWTPPILIAITAGIGYLFWRLLFHKR